MHLVNLTVPPSQEISIKMKLQQKAMEILFKKAVRPQQKLMES